VKNIFAEDLLTTAAAARFLSERLGDGKVSPTSLWRWISKGVLAADGQRVQLEHLKLGRRLMTSRQALARFAQRLGYATTELRPTVPLEQEALADLAAAGFFSQSPVETLADPEPACN